MTIPTPDEIDNLEIHSVLGEGYNIICDHGRPIAKIVRVNPEGRWVVDLVDGAAVTMPLVPRLEFPDSVKRALRDHYSNAHEIKTMADYYDLITA